MAEKKTTYCPNNDSDSDSETSDRDCSEQENETPMIKEKTKNCDRQKEVVKVQVEIGNDSGDAADTPGSDQASVGEDTPVCDQTSEDDQTSVGGQTVTHSHAKEVFSPQDPLHTGPTQTCQSAVTDTKQDFHGGINHEKRTMEDSERYRNLPPQADSQAETGKNLLHKDFHIPPGRGLASTDGGSIIAGFASVSPQPRPTSGDQCLASYNESTGFTKHFPSLTGSNSIEKSYNRIPDSHVTKKPTDASNDTSGMRTRSEPTFNDSKPTTRRPGLPKRTKYCPTDTSAELRKSPDLSHLGHKYDRSETERRPRRNLRRDRDIPEQSLHSTVNSNTKSSADANTNIHSAPLLTREDLDVAADTCSSARLSDSNTCRATPADRRGESGENRGDVSGDGPNASSFGANIAGSESDQHDPLVNTSESVSYNTASILKGNRGLLNLSSKDLNVREDSDTREPCTPKTLEKESSYRDQTQAERKKSRRTKTKDTQKTPRSTGSDTEQISGADRRRIRDQARFPKPKNRQKNRSAGVSGQQSNLELPGSGVSCAGSSSSPSCHAEQVPIGTSTLTLPLTSSLVPTSSSLTSSSTTTTTVAHSTQQSATICSLSSSLASHSTATTVTTGAKRSPTNGTPSAFTESSTMSLQAGSAKVQPAKSGNIARTAPESPSRFSVCATTTAAPDLTSLASSVLGIYTEGTAETSLCGPQLSTSTRSTAPTRTASADLLSTSLPVSSGVPVTLCASPVYTTATTHTTCAVTTTTTTCTTHRRQLCPPIGVRISPRYVLGTDTRAPPADPVPVSSLHPRGQHPHRRHIAPQLGPLVRFPCPVQITRSAHPPNTPVATMDVHHRAVDLSCCRNVSSSVPAAREARGHGDHREIREASSLEVTLQRETQENNWARAEGLGTLSTSGAGLLQSLLSHYKWGEERGTSQHAICRICRQNDVNVLLFQCHHRVLCCTCVRRIVRCPVCNNNVDFYTRLS